MDSLSQIYQDGTYAAKNPSFGDDHANLKISVALKAIREFKLRHENIAEVGCGGGAIISGLADCVKSQSAVGFEPMPEAFAVAKTRSSPGVEFRNEVIGPESRGNYDIVLCFDVFEHIEDYFSFLRNLRRIGENFLFNIPLDMNAQMVARGEPIRRVRDEVGHIHYFSKDSALASLTECGYTIGGCFYTFHGEGNSGGHLAFRLMKYPRKFLYAVNQDLAVRTLGGYSLLVWAFPKK
jgi:cyclopropane fatty-acyl-phospholipid synthase-like methyltransferase